MNLINLTPHTLNIYDEDEQHITTIEPSGTVARAIPHAEITDRIEGIPIFETMFVDSVDLPPAEDGTFYIVSRVLKIARPDRKDLLTPGQIRQRAGGITGTLGLGK